jgi:hypothetical protein
MGAYEDKACNKNPSDGVFAHHMKYYEQKYREQEIRSIQKKAKALGLTVTLTPAVAA